MSTRKVQTDQQDAGILDSMTAKPGTTTSTRSPQQVPAWLLDVLLGVAVALVIALVISAQQGGRRGPDVIAYLFACGFGALMLLRRQFPVPVLVVTMFLLFAYYTLGYPAIGLAVPVAAALYSAAERGHVASAIVISVMLILVSTYFRIQDGESLAFLLGYELVSTAALMAAAIALGDSTRSRLALRAEQEQTARLIEQEHRYRAEQRVQAERVRIARDLHDLLGHSISVISLQADVAREVIGTNDEEARQALNHIRTVSSHTMRELRSTVKLLRAGNEGQPERSLVSLSNLSLLIANAEATGLAVHVDLCGELASVPVVVDTAAYRIVQESLTNIIRHARATEVSLLIRIESAKLLLQITDNGQGALSGIAVGNGIAGMSERARLLGGVVTAQARPAGGFEVFAALPLKHTA